MENLMGLLRIHVLKGVNLAIRDVSSSDPYVVVRMGKQKLKTRVVKQNVNPEWNEHLTLSIEDPTLPIKLELKLQCCFNEHIYRYARDVENHISLGLWKFTKYGDDTKGVDLICKTVYDRDTFSLDDKMGDAEFDINPFLEALRMRLQGLPSGTIITKVQPNRDNSLAEESHIVWVNGKVVQNMFFRLRNVERGEVEIQLEWIDIPNSRGI